MFKKQIFTGISRLLILTVLIVLTTCDMPIGLGEMVNTEQPKIGLPGGLNSGPGTFLQGNSINTIEIQVDQPFGLSEVFMMVEYIDRVTGEPRTERINAYRDPSTGLWNVDIDTSIMADGQIMTQITAIDVSGNVTTTTGIPYNIKNNPPQVELTVPPFNRDAFDVPSVSAPFQFLQGNPIMGIAEDMAGIATGYPKIRIWPDPAENTEFPFVNLDADGIIDENDPIWGQWHSVRDGLNNRVNQNPGINLRATQFRWPLAEFDSNGEFLTETISGNERLKNLPLGNYRYQIMIKDIFGEVNYYPNRSDFNINVLGNNEQQLYMTAKIVPIDNPFIEWLENFPRAYNAKQSFSGDIRIVGGQGPYRVYVEISDKSNSTINSASDPFSITGGAHTIVLTVDQIKTMLLGSGASTDPNIYLPQLSGDRMLHILAIDALGKETVTSRPLIIDATPPQIQFMEPLQAVSPFQHLDQEFIKNVTSTVLIRGSVTDNQRPSEIHYALGRTAVNAIYANPANPIFDRNSIHWNKVDFPANPNNWTDNHSNIIRARWSGTISSWTWRFENIADVIQGTSGGQNDFVSAVPGSGERLWHLDMAFLAFDDAGNHIVQRIRLLIDPERDLPHLSINSHKNLETVGGPITIRGTAEDNEMIHSVEVRIFKQTDEQQGTTAIPTQPHSISGTPGTEAGWVRVQIPSHNQVPASYTSAVAWNLDLNRTGDLTPVEKPDPNHEVRRVLLQFRAVDSFGFHNPPQVKDTGIIQELTLIFDNTVPKINEEKFFVGIPSEIGAPALRNPTGGSEYEPGKTKLRNDFVFRTRIYSEAGIHTIRISDRRGNNIDLMTEPYFSHGLNNFEPWIHPIKTENGELHECYVFIPMRTNNNSDINSGGTRFGYGHLNKGEIFNVNIQVQDITTPAPYIAQNAYPLEVDNRYPLGRYTGNTFARGNFEIQGEAWDNGAGVGVQGIDRVVVYLTNQAGNLINLSTGIAAGAQSTPLNDVRQNRTGNENAIVNEGTNATITFPDLTEGKYISTISGFVISDVNDNPPANLYITRNFSGGNHKNWSVRYDTTRLRDGRYTLNYVIFDTADNATHYSTEIYVANRPPVIRQIRLGTSIDGRTGSDIPAGFYTPFGSGTSSIGYEEITTEFRVRNNLLNVQIDTDSTSGNGIKSYRVAHVTRNAGTAASNTTITKGTVYTIAELGTNINWFNYGVFGTPTVGSTFIATENHSVLAAAGMATGSGGSVYSYTNNNSNTIEIGSFGDGNHSVTGNTISFGSGSFGSSNIPESTNVTLNTTTGAISWDGKASDAPHGQKRFIMVHVYDTTVENADFNDQLSHVVLLNVGVNNVDEFDPRIELAPFGFNYVPEAADPNNYIKRVRTALADSEYTQNIVTSVTSNIDRRLHWKGYVQYASDAQTGDGGRANASGMVIFKGKVMDNNRISYITAEITNAAGNTALYTGTRPNMTNSNNGTINYQTTSEFLIAQWDTDRLRPSNIANTITAMRTDDAIQWGFEQTDAAITSDGHVLNWNFAFDTSRITNATAENVRITFRAYDSAGRFSIIDTTAATHNQININIVPYIHEVITPLSSAMSANPSAFNRSATGWYPVRENDIITIRGFNLGAVGGTSLEVSATVNVAGTVTGHTAPTAGTNITPFAVAIPGIAPAQYYRDRIQFNVGAAAVSGGLTVRVNNVNSVNNNTRKFISGTSNAPENRIHYNWEPNDLNNNILTNSRSLYVWRVGTFHDYGVTAPTTRAEFPYLNPIMRMDSGSRWYLAYGGAATAGAGIAGTTTIGGSQTTGKLYVASNSTTPVVPYNTQNRMRHTTVGFDAFTNVYTIGADQTAGQTNWRAAHTTGGFEGTWRTQATTVLPTAGGDKFQLPRIATQATAATHTTTNPVRILLSYFDNIDITGNLNQLRLHYSLNLSNAMATLSVANEQIVARNGNTHEGSMFAAVGFMSTGLPVIAWYDRTNMNLVLSHGNNIPANNTLTVTTSNPQWQTNARVVHGPAATGGRPTTAAGSHVDMVILNNVIHLAYFDVLNGGLYYARIPSHSAQIPSNTGVTTTIPNVDGATIVRVDTYLSAGTRIMLNVRTEGTRDVPYISYYHGSFDETRNSVRVAWQNNATLSAGSDENDRLTGTWEVMTVPARNVPASGQLIASGAPATGTLTGTVGLQGWNGNNITRTMIVTYMTSHNYEGAILKHGIY